MIPCLVYILKLLITLFRNGEIRNIDNMVYWYTHLLDLKLVRKENASAKLDLGGFYIDMLMVKGYYRQPSQNLTTAGQMLAQGWQHLVFDLGHLYKPI
jgi:hypothetical protein